MESRSYRSLLYVPADKPPFIEKAAQLDCDIVIFDWEDAIAPDAKEEARENLINTVSAGYARPYLLRINAVDTEFFKQDLLGLAKLNPLAVILPKADEESIRYFSSELDRLERESTDSKEPCKVIPLVESAKAIETMISLLGASSRVIGAQLGAEDLTADLGIERTSAGKEIEYARHRVVYGCRACGLPAYDTPFLDYTDSKALEADCVAAKSIGFSGKTCIHPSQTATVNAAFSPSDSEIEEARRILVMANEAKMTKGGVFSIDGKMVDGPVLQRARSILRRAGEL